MIPDAPPRPPNTDPLLRYVHSLPYFPLRIFLRKRISDRYPRFLYKYRAPINPEDLKGKAFGYLRDLIVEGRFFLSSPLQFNDPFDMTAFVMFSGTKQQKTDRFKRLFAEHAFRTGMRRKERKERVKLVMSLPEEQIVQTVGQIHAQHTAATGIVSFAGDPRSILMWSHYGEHHTGICLQFEIARDPGVLLWAVTMKYVRKYPTFNFAVSGSDEIEQTLLHKFKRWRYEHESRIVWPGGARTYLRFNAASLVGLIIGCRTADATKFAIRQLLEERASRGLPEIRLFAAKKHERSYALVIRRLQSV